MPLSGALLMLRGWEVLGMNRRLQCCVLLLLLWPLAGGRAAGSSPPSELRLLLEDAKKLAAPRDIS